MIRVLSDADVATVLDISDLLPVVAEAFRAQYRGDVERPDRPHFLVGFDAGPDPAAAAETAAGTALTMPAYIHGRDVYTTKLVAVHDENPTRGLPTVNAQIAVTDANDGQPAALLHGTRITNARTGCIGGIAARELAEGPITLGIVGAGTQARWQARAIDAATDLEHITIYSPSDSREHCAADLRSELGVPVEPTTSARDAVAGVDVVVTATNSTEPVLSADALEPGTLVIAIGAYNAETRELPPGVFERASTVYADVPEEVAQIGDLQGTGLTASDMVPFGALLVGSVDRSTDEWVDTSVETSGDIVVVESVGTAVLDAAATEHVLDVARERDVGTEVDL